MSEYQWATVSAVIFFTLPGNGQSLEGLSLRSETQSSPIGLNTAGDLSGVAAVALLFFADTYVAKASI